MEEPNRLNNELRFVELSICSYKLSMRIYLALRALRAVIYPFSGLLYIGHSGFALANAGLITHGDICTCLYRCYTHPLRPVYTRKGECVMSVIR